MPNLFRRLMLSLGAVVLSPAIFATTIEHSDDLEQKDINALREWINTKRQVTVKELGGALSIAGEVRTEFQKSTETSNGIRQRGHGGVAKGAGGLPIPSNGFDVEVNIMMDYRTDWTWAAIKLEFDNDAGIFSGTFNKVKLEKAYWGVRAINSALTFDIEAGRRRMSTIMDSKLEFNSFFDGAWFKYEQSFESIADFYVHAGVFVVNENREQFGYTGEIGMFNIGNTGLYTKYSLIDWDTKHLHRNVDRHRFDFIVSQLLFGYRFIPKRLQKVVLFYAAGLYNHMAQTLKITGHKKANFGAYAGFSIGEIKKQWDWALDVNYQFLAAQAVPDFDVAGIGMGNATNQGFYTNDVNGTGKRSRRKNAAGNVNYRGFQVTFDWLLSNQLDFQQSWQQSVTLDKSIGPFRRYKQYEVEFIYGF